MVQIDLNALNTIFTLARMKQVELAPQDEQALVMIIQIKQQVMAALTPKDGTSDNK